MIHFCKMITNYGRGKRSLAQAYKVTVPGLEFAQIPPFIPSKLHQIESPEDAIGNAGLANQVSKNTADVSTGTDTQEKKDESTGTEDAKDNSSASKNTTSTATSTEEQKDQSESVGTDSVENVDASTDTVTNEDASSTTNDNDEKKNEKNDEKEPIPESFPDTAADISLKAGVASTAAEGASFFLEKLLPYIPNPQEAVYLPQTFEEKYPNLNKWFELNKGNPEAIRRMENQIQTLDDQNTVERAYKELYNLEKNDPLSVQEKLKVLNDTYTANKLVRDELYDFYEGIKNVKPGEIEEFVRKTEMYSKKIKEASDKGILTENELNALKKEMEGMQEIVKLSEKESTLLKGVKASGKALSTVSKILGGVVTVASVVDDATKENDPASKSALVILDILAGVAGPEIAIPATIVHLLWPESLSNSEKNEFRAEEKEIGDKLKAIGSLEREKEKADPFTKRDFNPHIHDKQKEFNDAIDKHLKKLEVLFNREWVDAQGGSGSGLATSLIRGNIPNFNDYEPSGKENTDIQKLVARRDGLRQLKFQI
jgi:hypothetical protein